MYNLPKLFTTIYMAYVMISTAAATTINDKHNATTRNSSSSETGKPIRLDHIYLHKLSNTTPINNASTVKIISEGSPGTSRDLDPSPISLIKNKTIANEDQVSKAVTPDHTKPLNLNSTSPKPAVSKKNDLLAKPNNLENRTHTTSRGLDIISNKTETKVKSDEVVRKISTTKATTVRRKLKPVKTVSEPEDDEPLPPISTKSYDIRMPRKIDYVIPVILTVTCLPILMAIMYVVYHRGRDYWDKRHYRRMDFLIDGMYNE